MADTAISGLTAAATLTGAEVFPAVQSAADVKASITQVLAFAHKTGVYASRPTAAAANAGMLYYATDTQEVYRSNGSAWVVMSSGGTELGYADITADTADVTSTSLVDVTGLSVTCMVGERPILFVFEAPGYVGTSGTYVNISMKVGTTEYASVFVVATSAAETRFMHREVRISTLTPGTTYTFKIQIQSQSGGIVRIPAGSAQKSFIQVKTT